MKKVSVTVGVGEAIDRWVILQQKATRIPSAKEFLLAESAMYVDALYNVGVPFASLLSSDWVNTLIRIHEQLWDLEDNIRKVFLSFRPIEHTEDIGILQDICSMSYRIRTLNDDRAKIKKQIDGAFNSMSDVKCFGGVVLT